MLSSCSICQPFLISHHGFRKIQTQGNEQLARWRQRGRCNKLAALLKEINSALFHFYWIFFPKDLNIWKFAMIVYLFNVANFSRNNTRLLRPQLNQESIVQRATHQSLCGLLNQLIKHFNFIYHEGIESLVVRYGSVLSATFAERILFIMQVYRVLKKYSKFAFSKETVLRFEHFLAYSNVEYKWTQWYSI